MITQFLKEEVIPTFQSIWTDKEFRGLLLRRLRPYIAVIAGLAILIIVGLFLG